MTDTLANSKKTDNGGLFGKKPNTTGRMTFVPPIAEQIESVTGGLFGKKPNTTGRMTFVPPIAEQIESVTGGLFGKKPNTTGRMTFVPPIVETVIDYRIKKLLVYIDFNFYVKLILLSPPKERGLFGRIKRENSTFKYG